MASVLERPTPGLRHLLANSGQPRPWLPRRADLVTALLAVWFGLGLFVDAWAHANLAELETFFTPWHAMFYSGFGAVSAWICWQVWRQLRAGRRGLAALPVGYAGAVAAIPVFVLGGLADMTWHTFLGIEQTIDILFSPSHLLLLVSMLVIVTTPLRSAWTAPDLPAPGSAVRPGFARMLPALLGTAFSGSLVLLFLSYGNAVQWSAEPITTALSTVDFAGGRLFASDITMRIVITDVVLLAPLLLLVRRWAMPFGTATLIYTVACVLSGAQTAFGNPSTLLSVVGAGIAVDLLALWLRPSASRRFAYWAYAGLAGFVTWSLYIGVAAASAGRLPSVPEIWTGGPIVAGLIGLGLAVLLLPSGVAVPAGTATPPREVP